MNEIQVIARLKVHEGKLEEFRHIAEKCLHSVREKDTGTLQYEWYFSADHFECVVFERFRDSEAMIEHNENLGATVGELFALCSGSGEIYGTPSPALQERLKAIDARIYAPFQAL